MMQIDAFVLYNNARSRHTARRDQALSSARRAVKSPGWCEASKAGEQIRAWFDIWEKYLWETYKDEVERSLGQ